MNLLQLYFVSLTTIQRVPGMVSDVHNSKNDVKKKIVIYEEKVCVDDKLFTVVNRFSPRKL